MKKIMQDTEDDIAAQRAICSSAYSSLAILEKAFIRNGSGRYLVLRTNNEDALQRSDELLCNDHH